MGMYDEGSPEYDIAQFTGAEQTILERFSRFSYFGILIAGLVDGVNPCAFATLIFFVSYLLFIGKRRKDVILMALFFIIAVFTTYFAIGLGAYGLLKYLTGLEIVSRIIFLVFGVIALVLGVLSVRDYFMARKGDLSKMILQLPLGIKQRIHKSIKEKTAVGGIIIGSLIAGFLISFLEFGCTGQVYLPTITFMVSRMGFTLKPLIALILYNFMFVLPLIIIATLATLFSTKNIAKSLEKRIPTIKLITALLFFALGLLLILSA
jgi:cytochrome c biogenesis protein CcdA